MGGGFKATALIFRQFFLKKYNFCIVNSNIFLIFVVSNNEIHNSLKFIHL